MTLRPTSESAHGFAYAATMAGGVSAFAGRTPCLVRGLLRAMALPVSYAGQPGLGALVCTHATVGMAAGRQTQAASLLMSTFESIPKFESRVYPRCPRCHDKSGHHFIIISK